MKDLIQGPVFFNAIAFFIFLALALRYGRKPALNWIDGEIAKIRNELTAAHQLRAEAEAALAECKEKQIRAEAEAKAIVEMARKQVEALRIKAEADLVASLKRQEQSATERIRLVETQALTDVRMAVIDAAMTLVRKNLSAHLSDSDAAKLIDQAIKDIPHLKAL